MDKQPISVEWAKQLALLAFPKAHDFDRMRVNFVKGKFYEVRYFVSPSVDITRLPITNGYSDNPNCIRSIRLERFYDGYNDEVTPMGYDAEVNLLFVGI